MDEPAEDAEKYLGAERLWETKDTRGDGRHGDSLATEFIRLE